MGFKDWMTSLLAAPSMASTVIAHVRASRGRRYVERVAELSQLKSTLQSLELSGLDQDVSVEPRGKVRDKPMFRIDVAIRHACASCLRIAEHERPRYFTATERPY